VEVADGGPEHVVVAHGEILGSASVPYRVLATNLATTSTNKIHDDAVAQQYGFKGGLVPGVEVYAYLTHPLVERSRDWLTTGSMHVRLRRPVYDGGWVTITVTDEADGSLAVVGRDDDGTECAVATARLHGDTNSLPTYPRAPLPDPRPRASTESLRPGALLGTVDERFDAARAEEYLDAIGETLPAYRDERIAHPGWLLRRANRILSRNVEMGPWMHVESNVQQIGLVHDGEAVSTRGRVTDVFERGGHKFVTIDVVVYASGVPALRVGHTAIYEPRRT
jgi:hypothetical protein